MVGAGVGFQLRSQRNSAAEEEDGVQRVQDDHDDRVDGPVQVPRGREQVKESEHRKRRHKHRVVDRGRITREGPGDHVTDEGHDEESPHELYTRISSSSVGGARTGHTPPTRGDPTENPANSL